MLFFSSLKDKVWSTMQCITAYIRELCMLTVVRSNYYSNSNDSVASSSSKSLKFIQNALHGQVMLCCPSLVQGEICGVPISQLSCTTLSQRGLVGSYFTQMKEGQYSCNSISLEWGMYFLHNLRGINLTVEVRCVFVQFSVISQ